MIAPPANATASCRSCTVAVFLKHKDTTAFKSPPCVGLTQLESSWNQRGMELGGVAVTFNSAGKSVDIRMSMFTAVTLFGTLTFHCFAFELAPATTIWL